MPSDPRLTSLPALRKLAEEQAKSNFAEKMCAIRKHHPRFEGVYPWDDPPPLTREQLIRNQLARLSNLSRPASRDAVARLVAERIGWDAFDVTRAVESSTAMLAGLYRAAGLPELPRWEPAPTPAEALTMVAVAVLADVPHKPAARPPVDSSGRTCHDPGHVNMWHCDTCDAGVAVAPATRVEPAADLQDDDGEWIHDPDMGAR